MKTEKSTLLLAGAFLSFGAGFTTLNSQSVSTDPVGYVSTVVNANADLKIGVTLGQAPTFASNVGSVSVGTVTVSSTVPDVTTDAHYIQFCSGVLDGQWFEVTGYTASTVSVAEDLAAAGVLADDAFKVIPFWTLDTLFPDGGGVPQSSDVFNASGQVQFSNVNGVGINIATGAAYIYSDGSQLGTFGIPEGWLDINNPFDGLKGATVVSPESYLTIRNSTGSVATIINAGVVPVDTFASTVVSSSGGEQDSQIFNPFPADVELGSSELVSDGVIRASSDVFSPLDQLQIFPDSPTGINPSTSKTYIYHDGSQLGTFGFAEGWYDINNPFGGIKDTDVVPAGAALIVRRSVGSDELISWTPPVPYSLD